MAGAKSLPAHRSTVVSLVGFRSSDQVAAAGRADRRLLGRHPGASRAAAPATGRRAGIAPSGEVVALQPAQALAAFTSGAVDAWDIWPPYVQQDGAKVPG